MNNFIGSVIISLLGSLTICCLGVCSEDGGTLSYAEKLGWRLGSQAYTFRNFTFFEAVDKVASMKLKYIEAYPGQVISKDSDECFSYDMSAEAREKVIQKLKSAGVKLVCFGVTGAKDEVEWHKLFEFAKDMGIETITAEPDPEQMDYIEKFCDEFEINLAIHNHPEGSGSRYWNPDTVLEVVNGRSERIGSCADTGHWARSGLNPLECTRKLKGRIKSLHFKDLNMDGPDAHDVPWGTGVCNVYGILTELKEQNFKGVFSIEYEYNWDNSVPEVKQCVDYFGLVAASLVEEDYQQLLKNDLSNALFTEGGWIFENDVLASKGNGDIWTKERYGDFILDLEFKCDPDTNSGVFIRCKSIEEWLHTAIEVQVLQPVIENEKHNCGAIFDCLAPSKQMIKNPGEWNHYTIIADANKIYVILNGEQVINMDLDLWTEAHKNPDGSQNKFNYAYKDMPREGHIGLQYHGQPVWYRNLKIKTLH